MAPGYAIRLAAPHEISGLAEIERTAATLFLDRLEETGLTLDLLTRVTPRKHFRSAQQAGRLWVAVSPAAELVGFALVQEIGGLAHLDELDVLPSHGRMGIGSSLLAVVCAWATQAGYPAVTLSTFRHVPWNAPFYARHGFREVAPSDLSTDHVELIAAERQRGLRTDARVLMAFRTGALPAAPGLVRDR